MRLEHLLSGADYLIGIQVGTFMERQEEDRFAILYSLASCTASFCIIICKEIFDIMHKRKVKSTVAILRDKIHKNS